jgi:ribA/ribD-fused uncharacterized protein
MRNIMDEKITDRYVFFWHGIYSNWHPSKFIVDGVEYNCGEQYMMACKAKLFGDDETLSKIMDADAPKDMKVLGRQVKNFDAEVWDEKCKYLVYYGLYEKFTQNPEFKESMLATGNRRFVEASPYDKVWGIGMGVEHPDIEDSTKWQGTNYLGVVLDMVRLSIRRGD